jgi:hypothetical protein
MMAKDSRRFSFLATLAVSLFACTILHADSGRFDLIGPKLEVHVTRSGKTLPIAQVPNLQPGDKLWLHPDFPPTQSVHYLLIAAFLRGTTNPPPDNWFFRIQTWNKQVREEGVTITVPNEAQQVILFLAPETGGDFSTLRSAVRGRPGVFVRASQDLTEAGFEQARIEKYLAAMKQVPASDPKALEEHSTFLARTLNLKPNKDCFERPVDTQYTCLTQTGTQTLLDDGHGQTVVASLSSGNNSDFINQASYMGLAGAGNYSAYVGAIVDLVRIMSSLHTAKYQYIPAIAFPDGESLNLRLNTPPSFNDPKSVIVIGLPAVQAAVPPPLRPTDPTQINCLLKPGVVLPIEGAPLVYSTGFAHDLVLHIDSTGADIPVTPDAYLGGLVLAKLPPRKILPSDSDTTTSTPNSAAAKPAPTPPAAEPKPSPSAAVTGIIKGFWGFDPYTGPSVELQQIPGTGWKLAEDDVLIAGRENHLTLTSTGTACIQKVTLDTASDKLIETEWKPANKPSSVDVSVSLKTLNPGPLHLSIEQYGSTRPDTVAAETYSEPARLVSLELHAGDTTADLTGTNLDQVQQLSINDLIYTPSLSPAGTESASPDSTTPTTTLRLSLAPNVPTPKYRVGDQLTAKFSLKDGRTLTLPVKVASPRPSVTLISKSIGQAPNSPIHIANQDDLPADQQLTFSLKSATPFPRTGQIEVASTDDTLHTTLSVSNGSLVLQNPRTLLATLDPLKAFGASAFGPLRIRPVSPNGTTGDWLPLVTLVRLPTLKDLHCPTDQTQPCTLSGSSLYLVDSIADDAAFTTPTAVPEGFIGTTLSLPRPAKTGFFLRLRDDPTTTNTVTMPIQLQPLTAERKDAQPQ